MHLQRCVRNVTCPHQLLLYSKQENNQFLTAASCWHIRQWPDGWECPDVIHECSPFCPQDGGSRPPLLFVHGSFHAAWCYRVTP